MKENKGENLIWVIFAIIGAVFTVIGLVVSGNVFNYKNKVETTGIITEITSYRDDYNEDNNRSHEVYVSYTVDGKKYESKLNSYSFTFYEGKEINIYYDKNDPSKIGNKSLNLLVLMFPILGMIFLIVGVRGILVKAKKSKDEKNLKENGELIYADYVETVLNTLYAVNGKNPYNIICEWNNPLDSKKYIFKSNNIWINPKSIIEERNIKQFPVYINRDNIEKYVIDIDVLTENIIDLR